MYLRQLWLQFERALHGEASSPGSLFRPVAKEVLQAVVAADLGPCESEVLVQFGGKSVHGERPTPILVTAAPSRLEAADSAAKALDLMERLPGKQAEAVRLKFEHGLSYQEISRRIDVSVGQVGWLLHMALKALRTELSGDGDAAVEQGARA